MMSIAASRVVTSEHLFPMITSFQMGLPVYMFPVRDACRAIASLLAPHQNRPTHRIAMPLDVILAAHPFISRWFSRHDLQHLDQLYIDMGGSHHVIRLHATYFGMIPVLRHEHKRTRGGLHTCPWYLIDVAAEGGQFGVIQYLDSIDYTGCSKAAMDHAAIKNFPAIVNWLHKNRRDGCSDKALTGAVAARNKVMVQWLVNNRPESLLGIDDAIMKAVETQQDDILDLLVDVSRTRGVL
ncbi:unnamed protein product [Aphanomyces euteiches]